MSEPLPVASVSPADSGGTPERNACSARVVALPTSKTTPPTAYRPSSRQASARRA